MFVPHFMYPSRALSGQPHLLLTDLVKTGALLRFPYDPAPPVWSKARTRTNNCEPRRVTVKAEPVGPIMPRRTAMHKADPLRLGFLIQEDIH